MATVRQIAHILFTQAEQADARFSEAVRSRSNGQRDRWTMNATDWLIAEVRDAYREKVNADEVWLTFLRTNRAAREKLSAPALKREDRDGF